MVVHIKRLVIDSMKARETTVLDLSRALAMVDGVDEVDITVTEVDSKTETIRLTIRGSHLDFEAIGKVMADHGATMRSIDEITVTKTKPPVTK